MLAWMPWMWAWNLPQHAPINIGCIYASDAINVGGIQAVAGILVGGISVAYSQPGISVVRLQPDAASHCP